MISWKEGERYAAEYLEGKGYRIIERNFRTRRGEIDIIAASYDTLVCVEVKTWKDPSLEYMEHTIDGRKRRTYIQVCNSFTYMNQEYSGYFIRFDLICIDAINGSIKHIKNAFTENG